MIRFDLSLLADTARMADEIAGLADRLHVLINNADGVRDHRRLRPKAMRSPSPATISVISR